jgi:very-short-patch-repair endonuclease
VALSHRSAGALWGLCAPGSLVEVTIRRAAPVRRPGIRVYRRAALSDADVVIERGIPVTTVARTVIDLAVRFAREPLEAVINEADRSGLIDPEGLREELLRRGPVPGARNLRAVLDRRTFRLTDSQLERRFMPIARRAGLSPPLTRQIVNGYRVDFYWPELGLVVETDGLRYHRTAARQSRDARRDQVHTAAGLTPLRFTHEQVRYAPAEVESTLRRVAARLRI